MYGCIVVNEQRLPLKMGRRELAKFFFFSFSLILVGILVALASAVTLIIYEGTASSYLSLSNTSTYVKHTTPSQLWLADYLTWYAHNRRNESIPALIYNPPPAETTPVQVRYKALLWTYAIAVASKRRFFVNSSSTSTDERFQWRTEFSNDNINSIGLQVFQYEYEPHVHLQRLDGTHFDPMLAQDYIKTRIAAKGLPSFGWSVRREIMHALMEPYFYSDEFKTAWKASKQQYGLCGYHETCFRRLEYIAVFKGKESNLKCLESYLLPSSSARTVLVADVNASSLSLPNHVNVVAIQKATSFHKNQAELVRLKLVGDASRIISFGTETKAETAFLMGSSRFYTVINNHQCDVSEVDVERSKPSW